MNTKSEKILLLKWLFCIMVATTFTMSCDQTTPSLSSSGSASVNSGDPTINMIRKYESHLILTRHARCRMECRHIDQTEIKEIIDAGTINYRKSEETDARGPKYAMEGYSHAHQHLRIIVAPENNSLVIVTCIDLDNEWGCPDCK